MTEAMSQFAESAKVIVKEEIDIGFACLDCKKSFLFESEHQQIHEE